MDKKTIRGNEVLVLENGLVASPNDAISIVGNIFQNDKLFTGQYEEIIKNDDGSEVTVYNGKFHLYGNHRGKSEIRITDESLLRSTSKIMVGKKTGELVSRVLCRELFNIEAAGTYRAMGFKSIGEYGSKLFDLKSVTCSQYVRIGKFFINDDYSDKSAFTDTLTISHLLELLTYVDEESENPLKDIEMAFANSVINDCMSCRDMRNALKSHFKGDADVDDTKTNKDNEKGVNNADKGGKSTDESNDKTVHEPNANTPIDTSLIEKKAMCLSLLSELPVTEGMPEVDAKIGEAIDIVIDWLKS